MKYYKRKYENRRLSVTEYAANEAIKTFNYN